MPSNEIKTNKSFKEPANNQQKLVNAVNSIDAKEENLDLQHNTKRRALGPNTKK